MTDPNSEAWDELQWATRFRDRLVFKEDKVYVGQLVFKYDDATYEWTPYWVVSEDDGLYELMSAYGVERVEGVSADKLGVAVSATGVTYRESH